MVSISLRSYLSEINDLIDQRQIDEAIANCRHILETYPKHVDTYRLLGKSYLEEQRYSDASDILQRVLSSVPEDFISQVGMSIIREDEGNLDSAIYHMERAFETQPSNHAIQDELRRLHSQRDGVELKRVRLTRGALARMYAHGNLYEQAISELMAALSEDPNRFDLQSLLADMYYNTDKKVDAAETCTKILEKLPHCLNANRLLTIILEESGRPEEAHRYRKRWAALDPYAAFVGAEYALIEQVPDNQVTLDKFEWDPSSLLDSEGGQPAWAASLGVSLSGEEQTSEPLPDWLSDTAPQPEETPLDMDADLDDDEEFRPTEMLPESLAAGGEFEDDSSAIDGDHIDLFPPTDDGEEDWLSSLDVPEDSSSAGEPDLFADLTSEPDSGDDWLAPADESTTAAEDSLFASAADDGEDDWLASLDSTRDAPAEESVEETDLFAAPSGEDDTGGDWLASLDTPDEEPAPAAAPDEETSPDDWLGSLESAVEEPAPAASDESKADEELPDFLKEAGWGPDSGTFDESKPVDYTAADEADEPEDEIVQGEVPDWIQQMAPTEDASPEPELEAEADPEWMKSMQAPSEADSPAWLKELGSSEDEEEEEAFEAPPVVEAPTPVDTPSATEAPQPEPYAAAETPVAGIEIEPDEMDMAWLENLAAKQGIPDEEMVTSVEQRAEITEDHKPTTGELEATPAPEEVQADSDWLQALGQEDEPEEAVEPAGEDTADWLSSIAEDDEISAQPGPEDDDTISRFLAAKETPGSADEPGIEAFGEEEGDWDGEIDLDITPEPVTPASPVDEEADDIDMDWLSEISDQAAAEAAPEEPADTVPDMAAPTIDEPADDGWLAELDQPEAEATEPMEELSPVDQEADTLDTDWLKKISEEATAEAAEEAPQAAPADDEPADDDWLAGLGQPESEATLPSATAPVDEEQDDFDTSWLDDISEEAAAEAGAIEATPEMPAPETEETADQDWLTELDQPEAEATLPSAAAPVDEEQDDFDTSWLDDISEEAAAEAGAIEATPEMPAPETETPADQDWLTELEQPKAEATQPSAPPPVDEEEDDFDMDWLDDISEEAAAEAGAIEATPEMPAPETEAPAEEDWLTGLEQPEAEATQPSGLPPVDEEEDAFDMDWLDDISEEAAAEAADEPISQMPAPPAEEPALVEQPEAEATQPSGFVPVDEEEDDFDMDWLDDISEEAAAEAASEGPVGIEDETPDSTEDAPVEDNLLADLEDALEEASWPTTAMLSEDDLEDREDDWEVEIPPESPASFGEVPAEEDTIAETPEPESPATQPSPVDEDRDDFNTAWLDDIGAQAALEAAGSESQPTTSEDEPSGEDWLTRLEEEDELAHGQSISDTDAWLLSMEEAEENDTYGQPSIADTGQWLDTLGIEQEESAPEAEISETEPVETAEPEPPAELPTEEELEAPGELEEAPAAGVLPTQEDEWMPEAEIEAEPQLPEAQPEPAPPAEPVAAVDNDLEAARQEVSSGNMDQALTTYGSLIKKGKSIDEIISDLTDATLRHPINVRLWQTLGDAYMRIDNLQDALDAYSKAEDLLR